MAKPLVRGELFVRIPSSFAKATADKQESRGISGGVGGGVAFRFFRQQQLLYFLQQLNYGVPLIGV